MSFDKGKVVEALTGEWQVGLFSSCCESPGVFLFSAVLPCCKAYNQRLEILEITREPYVCCGGICPCGPCGKPCDQRWLCVEAACCSQFAIAGNRFLIQTRFDRKNTGCDDCILTVTAALAMLSCLLAMMGNESEGFENIVQCLVCTVNACMLTQQDVELKYIRSVGYNGIPTHIMQFLPVQTAQYVVVMPPQQQQMNAVYGKPAYRQPLYGQPAYGQPQAVYGQPVYEQPAIVARPVYAQPPQQERF